MVMPGAQDVLQGEGASAPARILLRRWVARRGSRKRRASPPEYTRASLIIWALCLAPPWMHIPPQPCGCRASRRHPCAGVRAGTGTGSADDEQAAWSSLPSEAVPGAPSHPWAGRLTCLHGLHAWIQETVPVSSNGRTSAVRPCCAASTVRTTGATVHRRKYARQRNPLERGRPGDQLTRRGTL